MKITGPQTISQLREGLRVEVGRHLYAVLAPYARLAQFERVDLAGATGPDGHPLPAPLNLNRELLARIGDEDLNAMVGDEAKYPTQVRRRLNEELRALLTDSLRKAPLVILKQVELLFAYELDLSILRTLAANRSHILLLLPGARVGEQITLFHEAEARFHRPFPAGLITENHLWELSDDAIH